MLLCHIHPEIKHLLAGDKIYFDVGQETQAETVLTEVGEEIFKDHLITSDREQIKAVGARTMSRTGKFLQQIRL